MGDITDLKAKNEKLLDEVKEKINERNKDLNNLEEKIQKLKEDIKNPTEKKNENGSKFGEYHLMHWANELTDLADKICAFGNLVSFSDLSGIGQSIDFCHGIGILIHDFGADLDSMKNKMLSGEDAKKHYTHRQYLSGYYGSDSDK